MSPLQTRVPRDQPVGQPSPPGLPGTFSVPALKVMKSRKTPAPARGMVGHLMAESSFSVSPESLSPAPAQRGLGGQRNKTGHLVAPFLPLSLGHSTILEALTSGAIWPTPPYPGSSRWDPGRQCSTPPASQVSPGSRLEGHNDVCDLEVPLLLQLGQDPCPEEDLALSHTVEVGVQFQSLDL